MSAHMQRELEGLRRGVLDMSARVEGNFRDAARAFLERDVALANAAIGADPEIDAIELDLEEDCLKILALHQPVAGDLRFVFSLAKIVGMLERISDLAGNLARKARTLSRHEAVPLPDEFPAMIATAEKMLSDAIEAFIAQDTIAAEAVIRADEGVNLCKHQIRKRAEREIMERPERCPQWLAVIAAARNIERMADMAVNIAAEIVYVVEGRNVRHLSDTE